MAILAASSRPLDAQDSRAALLAADRTVSDVSNDSGLVVALRRFMDPDGLLLWPGAPVVAGASDIGKVLASLPYRDSLRLTWQPLGIEVARDSTLGVTWGVTAASPRVVSGPPRLGRYIAVWGRDQERWILAALLVVGTDPVSSSALPRGLRLTRVPAPPSGTGTPFIAADLAFARLAADSGAAIAFQRWAAPNAVIFGGGGVLAHGPKAIAEVVTGPAKWRWHPVAAGASQAGDLGWTVGEAVIAPPHAEPNYSKYLTIWMRLPRGEIRFVNDGGNARPPTP
jgi:hypothetical protein